MSPGQLLMVSFYRLYRQHDSVFFKLSQHRPNAIFLPADPKSPTLSPANEIQKSVKQVGAVLGARRAFGMVLYSESSVPGALHSFDRSVQKIDMSDCKGGICQALLFDGIGAPPRWEGRWLWNASGFP